MEEYTAPKKNKIYEHILNQADLYDKLGKNKKQKQKPNKQGQM